MFSNDLIPANDFCVVHHVEITFVRTLAHRGLINLVTVEQTDYVRPEQLSHLEKLVRLHQELDIHPNDLDIVSNLLEQIENLNKQVVSLQNQLRFYT